MTTNSSTESTIQTNLTLDSKVNEEPLYQPEIEPKVVNKNDWIPVQHNKRKNSITAEAPIKKSPSIQSLIKKRGEYQIDSVKNLLTPVKNEFLINGKNTLNVRNEFITVFDAIKKVDITLAVVTEEKVRYN